MPLTAGQTLTHYEILGPLGAGGMGEVWRARDTRLQREVAIKVLPEHFADDEERLRRFEREARTLASLNHPNVAGIHGIDQVGDTCFLAMELVAGEDLATRLAHGPLPVDEALDVCRQIAEGLEAAHEAGVVHRDLKPANVRVTPEGVVKILDFGLAKPIHPKAGESGTTAAESDSLLVTEEGLVLGTPTYMSPEQARGRQVDRRTDVWAFGCVLYECLAGRRAFGGESLTDVLASILGAEPDWSRLPRDVDPHVLRLLARCLEKNPRSRLRDIGEGRIALERGADEPDAAGASLARRPSPALVAVVATIGVVVGLLVARWWPGGGGSGAEPARTSKVPPVHLELALEAAHALARGTSTIGFDNRLIALSPDGRWLVHVGRDGDGTRLFKRDLFGFDPAQPMPGTEGAVHAFFSPRGDEVGFITVDQLKRASLDGGVVVPVVDVDLCVRGVWTEDDTIYFGDVVGTVIRRVSASGGPVETIGAFSDGLADVLPDGSGALIANRRGLGISGDHARIDFVDTETGEITPLIENGYEPQFLPGGRGIAFARGGQLFTVPFDPETLECTGTPRLAMSGVAMESLFCQAQFSLGAGGGLAFVPGADHSLGRLAWLDREGNRGTLDIPPRVFGSLDLDDADERIAVHVADVIDHVLICDIESGTERVLRRRHRDGWPRWSHAGDRLAFSTRDEEGSFSLNVIPLAPGSDAITLASGMPSCFPTSWSRDDDRIGYHRWDRFSDPPMSAYVMDMEGDAVLLASSAFMPSFSPDGGWVAHTSTKPGETEVHVRRWPAGDEVHRLPIEDAIEPIWSRSGEVILRRGTTWWSVPVTTDPELRIGEPVLAFETPFLDTLGVSYDVSSDGQRLYFVEPVEEVVVDRIRVVTSWP